MATPSSYRSATRVVAMLIMLLLCEPHSIRSAWAATPGDYARRIDAALAALRQAQHAAGTARLDALRTARRLLDGVPPVQIGSVRVQADVSGVRADLASGRRLADATARLAALRDALHSPSARVIAPDTHGLGRLDAILQQPPFTTRGTGLDALARWIHNSAVGAIIDSITRLLRNLLGGAADPVGNALPYLAAIVVAGVLVFVASRFFGVFVPETAIPESGDERPIVRVDRETARRRAVDLAAAGDYREAARYVFLATLLALDESGRLRIDEATGNRDLLRQARATPRLAEALGPVVRGFDYIWFGHAALTRDDFERYRQLNERVLEVAE